MDHNVISSILTCFTCLSLSILAYLKKRKSPLNRIFALYSLSVAIWSFGFLKMITARNSEEGLFWARALHIGAIFIPMLYVHVACAFLNITHQKKRAILIGYTICFLLLSICFTPLFVSHAPARPHFRFFVGHGILYHLFTLFFFTCIIYSQYKLFKGYRISYGQKRNQIKYVFIAYLIGYTGGAVAFAPLFNIPTPTWGLYPIPIGLLIIAYAIVKHKLLDINIVFRKTLVYSLIIGFLFTVSVVILFTSAQLLGGLLPQRTFWLTLFLVIILSLLFQLAYKKSTSLIDKLFFKGTLPQIAEELQRSQKLASLGVLASGLAHEIKNPLVPIKTKVEQLQKHITEDQRKSEFFQKFFSAIPYEINRITGLLNQLKEFASPSNLEIEKDYQIANPVIQADPNKLGQVFFNLFQNAIEAMPNGRILSIFCGISMMPGQNEEAILIKIQDTGFGIPKGDLTKIFDPFFSKKKTGSGLGLAVSHQIIKNHGGMILAESEINKGSTFSIYLPCIIK